MPSGGTPRLAAKRSDSQEQKRSHGRQDAGRECTTDAQANANSEATIQRADHAGGFLAHALESALLGRGDKLLDQRRSFLSR